MAFGVWLLSLKPCVLRDCLLQRVSVLLCFPGYVTFHCTNKPHFVYPLTHWWTSGLFPLRLAIANNACNASYIHVQVFVWTQVWFLSGRHLRSRIAGSDGTLPPLWLLVCVCVSRKTLKFTSHNSKTWLRRGQLTRFVLSKMVVNKHLPLNPNTQNKWTPLWRRRICVSPQVLLQVLSYSFLCFLLLPLSAPEGCI